jgi:TonB family protein
VPPPESEAPVAINPDVPIAYPPGLFERKVEGDVTLRLFVDSTGKLIPESTRVAEASGYPALDSAALAGAAALRFAPAKRHGVPVATAFLQPVEFRQVGTTRAGGAAGVGGAGGAGGAVTLPPAPEPTPPAPPPPPPRPRRRLVPRDTTRADTTKTRADTTKARPDTTRPDTTKARPDTSASAH